MTGSINPELPSGGEPRGTADGKIKGSLITLRDALNGLLNSENKVTKASAESGLYSKIIPAEQVITTTTFKKMSENGAGGTADEIPGIVMAENGLLLIGFSGAVKSSSSSEGRVGLFLGANQTKVQNTSGSLSNVEVTTFNTAFHRVVSSPSLGLSSAEGATFTSDETTGQVLGYSTAGAGGLVAIFVAAGTYTVSVKFKAAAGSVTAKERKLWVVLPG